MDEQKKKCNVCEAVLLLSNFSKAPTCRDGYRGDCKKCVAAKYRVRRAKKKENFKKPDMTGSKRCTQCALEKPVADFYFKVESSDGFASHCKECQATLSRLNKQSKDRPRRVVGFKLCSKCGLEKAVEDFPSVKSSPDGLGCQCKCCGLDYQSDRRRTHIFTKLSHRLDTRARKHKPHIVKCGSPLKFLGCTIKEFAKHLESLFFEHPRTGDLMVWDNWGRHTKDGPKTWQLDHIKPLSSFDLTDKDQLSEAYHYTNIRPLWGEYNLSNPKNIVSKEVTQ